ncbi:MAG: hypothetical protein VX589_13335 [Myxococcota bacterium]|nr:hypothetical protein [Myxococcota bacterium]
MGFSRFLARQIGPMDNFRPSKHHPTALRPDIVLIQGYFTTPASIQTLSEYFRSRGFKCAVPSLGGLGGQWQTDRVHRSGDALSGYLQSLPSGTKPWVVGHSLGGILARYAVQLGGAESRVQGVLTLGSPHAGCPLAYLAVPLGFGLLARAAIDLQPRSRLMKKLNQLRWPDGIPLISVASHGDVLCRPRDARLVGPGTEGADVIELDRAGHTELVRAPHLLARYIDLMGLTPSSRDHWCTGQHRRKATLHTEGTAREITPMGAAYG